MADERKPLTLEEVQERRENWLQDLDAEADGVEKKITAALQQLKALRARRDELYATMRDLRPRRRRAKKGGVVL